MKKVGSSILPALIGGMASLFLLVSADVANATVYSFTMTSSFTNPVFVAGTATGLTFGLNENGLLCRGCR
jgi:hypothetical protein